MKRFLSISMIIVLILASVVFAEGTQSRSGNFSSNYTLTGVGATDIVNIALAQEGKTGSQLGYTEQWCADFVSDCAKLAGQSSAVPANGGTTALKKAIRAAGGSVTTSSPRAGDICFVDWGGDGGIDHVEIVYNVVGNKVYTIGGNSGHPSGTDNLYNRYVYKHAPLSSSYIESIVRPNYSNSQHQHNFSVYLWYWKAHPHYNEYKCSYCEATEVRKSETNYLSSCEKCNHVHDYTQYRYAPNCTDQGVSHYVCSCGEEYSEVYSSALGHDFSKLSYSEEAHPHYKVYSCSRNGCVEKKKTTETSFSASCAWCNPSAFCANLGDDFYGLILNTACWKPISKTAGTRDISLQTENGSSMQKWRFQRQSDGAYVITSCYDGTVLEMTDGIREKNGTRMTSKTDYSEKNYQQWYLIPQGSGYIFLNKHYPSEQWVMDLSGNYTFDGNGIYIYPINYSDGQIWSVYNREEVQLQSAELSATVEGTKVTFTWSHAYGATGYVMKIFTEEQWNNQTGPYVTYGGNVKSGFKEELPPGKYYAYIESVDYYDFKMSNVVDFEILETATSAPENGSITCPECGESFADETEYNAHTETCGTDDTGTSLGFFGMLISLFVSFFSLIASIFTLPFALIFG